MTDTPTPTAPETDELEKLLDQLWQEYLEAATANGSTENGAIDLYDIEGMDEAAHAIFEHGQGLRTALRAKGVR